MCFAHFTHLGPLFEQLPGEREYPQDDISTTVIYEDHHTLMWGTSQPGQPGLEIIMQPRSC